MHTSHTMYTENTIQIMHTMHTVHTMHIMHTMHFMHTMDDIATEYHPLLFSLIHNFTDHFFKTFSFTTKSRKWFSKVSLQISVCTDTIRL